MHMMHQQPKGLGLDFAIAAGSWGVHLDDVAAYESIFDIDEIDELARESYTK
jgi:hypothetical protein